MVEAVDDIDMVNEEEVYTKKEKVRKVEKTRR